MPDVTFHYPQLLTLLLLLPLAYRYLCAGRRGIASWMRLAVFALAVLALSGPRLGRTGNETDVIVIVDRSASIAAESEPMLRELLPLLRLEERSGDRTAVVSFGDGAVVERGFASGDQGSPPPDDFEFVSDLASAVRLASSMRSPDRRTAILCLSDGLYTGENPLSPELVATLAGTPFWYRHLGNTAGLDVSAGEIVVPEEVEPRSGWLVRYSIHASSPVETEYELSRNGFVVASGKVRLRRGENHFFVRDTSGDEALLRYRLSTRTVGDGLPQNDVSRAVLRVRSAPRTLLVSDGAEEGLLARILRSAAIPVDIVDPASFPGDAVSLSPYRLIVLENCRLTDFPGRGVGALAGAVEAGVSSLLVTGGQNSFGMGGYHRSAVDPLLPVEMELRNDIRRGSMALAIALDRSGSMAVPVDDGMVKMDLANLGAAESIRLLSASDHVSVIAVDSAAHVVIPLSVADSVEPLAKLTLGIQPMGGGIFCHTALMAAAEEVRKSTLSNRNILLFADASDAEEQEGCFDLARELLREGIKISVVAMGDESDVDAQFLIELARIGGGEALFSNHATGLPAMFTQEVMRISRRGFIEEEVTPRLLSATHLLGIGELGAAPRLDGYNVSALRDGATAFMVMNDEFSTPLLATRSLGRAMTGAILFEVEGEFSGSFSRWSKTPDLLVALARRLAGGIHPAGVKAYSHMERGRAEAEFEFAPETARAVRAGEVEVEWVGPGGVRVATDLEWLDGNRARSVARLVVPGHYMPLADLGAAGVAAAPPVSVSFSSEYELRDGRQGWATLADLAAATGGGEGVDISAVRSSADVVGRGGMETRPYLLAAIVLLFLLELSGRRLAWL